MLKSFSDLFTQNYVGQKEQWEKLLKAELKTENIDPQAFRPSLEFKKWPSLSLDAKNSSHLSTKTAWKKAAQTYIKIDTSQMSQMIHEDLEAGVRVFFFHQNFLSEESLKEIEKIIQSHSKASEVEIFLLGPGHYQSTGQVKIIDETQILCASNIHDQGGQNVQELAYLAYQLIEKRHHAPSYLGVYVDSHFFKNIAKIRALKLLVQKILKESQMDAHIQIVALNSYREWTLFERYSNILRNDAQVASAYIAGADVIQSSGYQVVFDLETTVEDADHNDRSRRMARNTSHIIGLESMLGLVEDSAYGSYYLEDLTHQYAQRAWDLMKELLNLPKNQREDFINTQIQDVCSQRLERIKTRKDVLAGINDYPDASERLGIKLSQTNFFRVARPFEELRLKVEKLPMLPRVHICLKGDYAQLINRMNFIKNYFELIGLEVKNSTEQIVSTDNEIIVLCAKDEEYLDLKNQVENQRYLARFVAGKTKIDGFENIYSGQDIYQVLSALVLKLGMKNERG